MWIVLYSSQDRWWKIADFGLTSTAASTQLQTTSAARGKCSYRAPELLLGPKSRYNQKSDLWALGCILYELITGATPFKNDFSVHQYALSGAQDENFLNLDQLSAPFRKGPWGIWLKELLNIDPHQRPSAKQSAAYLYDLILSLGSRVADQNSRDDDIGRLLESENMLGTDLPTMSGRLEWDDVLSRRGDQHDYTLRRYSGLLHARGLLLDPSHPYTIWSILSNAWADICMGTDEDAARLVEDVVEMRTAGLGAEHHET